MHPPYGTTSPDGKLLAHVTRGADSRLQVISTDSLREIRSFPMPSDIPGKQMTPFEFVLIFFIGGLALTAMVGDEVSFTNAICQIITIGFAHYTLAWARSKSHRVARLVDGTSLILLEHKAWRAHTLGHMRISDDDVMASARDSPGGRRAALSFLGQYADLGMADTQS
jgi:hypothetical protein